MTLLHFLYIPTVFTLGLMSGYVLGARAVKQELKDAQRRAKR